MIPILSIIVCTSTQATCITVPSDLVGFWPAEGNAADLTGMNNGQLQGNTSFGGGVVGQAFTFDGNADLVVISNNPSLQMQDLTIEAWVKRSDLDTVSYGSGGNGVIFGYGQGGYSLYMNAYGRLQFAKLGFPGAADGNLSITDLNFHHVAVTKTGGNVVFYIDGVADPVGTYDPGFEFTTDLAIGARSDNLDNCFLGQIDELSVYRRALSQSEIQSIYHAGVDGKCLGDNSVSPKITVQPNNASVEIGGQATFLVTAYGTPPLKYQWQFKGTNVEGAISPSLTLTNVQMFQAGGYSVLVTNGTGSAQSSNGILTIVLPPDCTSVPQGIVSWWRGDSAAFDQFNLNNGSLVGNAAYAAGRVGSGFQFDGSGDLVSIANNVNLQLQDFTIEAWIKRGSSSIVSSGSGGNGALFGYGSGGYLLYLNPVGHAVLSKLGGSFPPSSSWQISDTNFHHVAVSKSGTAITFYLDGTNISFGTYNTTFAFNTSVGIGGRPDNLDNSFLGMIDELAVYNRVLSAAEIQAIRNSGSSGKCVVPTAPVVVVQPTNQTVIPGVNIKLAPTVTGTPPFQYQWQKDSVAITNATNISLSITNVQPSDAGAYFLLASNAQGWAVTSNAIIKVTVVTATGNDRALTNGINYFGGSVNIQLQNIYPGGLIFYTLDGSEPSFASIQYSGSFMVTEDVVLRAIGYRADFFESGEMDPVSISILPSYSLAATSRGGGTVTLNPVAASFMSNTVVNLTAVPASGWSFMQWLGDASGTNPLTSVTMNRQKSVEAVFGTTLITTAAGGGTVVRNPAGNVYPYGSTIQLSAIPQAGNYFAIWGNAAGGNVNPLSFSLTNANPTVSSLFVATGAGQVGLTVVPTGLGQISVDPRANVYASGASVTITATPVAGQTFIGWSGDATGTQNPLSVTMDQSRLIYANFTRRAYLTGEMFLNDGLQISLSGDYPATYQIDESTNLENWAPALMLTNISGTAQFLDSTATNGLMRFYRARILP